MKQISDKRLPCRKYPIRIWNLQHESLTLRLVEASLPANFFVSLVAFVKVYTGRLADRAFLTCSSRNDLIKLGTFLHAALTRYVTGRFIILCPWLSLPCPLPPLTIISLFSSTLNFLTTIKSRFEMKDESWKMKICVKDRRYKMLENIWEVIVNDLFS